MPLVAHSNLPTFGHLSDRGHDVLPLQQARHQDIRELHIGFLNMMPDAALQATERQFIRLVGSCNRIAQFFVHPFSLAELPRSEQAQQYVDQYYERFDDLKVKGLDALIITGANVTSPALDSQPFWQPLLDVVDWAEQNVCSILCSCLATHALLRRSYQIERQPLPRKKWGVFSHRVMIPEHPLLSGINTRFDVPHSRHNDISRQQLEAAGLSILVESEQGGVHLATSPDQFRAIYFQGHPEYDAVSLFKEFKREVMRFVAGERPQLPSNPEHYFSTTLDAQLASYVERLVETPDADVASIEREITAQLDNTWGDTAKAVFNNWLGLVYRTTNLDRTQQFMSGVNPQDPLALQPSNPLHSTGTTSP